MTSAYINVTHILKRSRLCYLVVFDVTKRRVPPKIVLWLLHLFPYLERSGPPLHHLCSPALTLCPFMTLPLSLLFFSISSKQTHVDLPKQEILPTTMLPCRIKDSLLSLFSPRPPKWGSISWPNSLPLSLHPLSWTFSTHLGCSQWPAEDPWAKLSLGSWPPLPPVYGISFPECPSRPSSHAQLNFHLLSQTAFYLKLFYFTQLGQHDSNHPT